MKISSSLTVGALGGDRLGQFLGRSGTHGVDGAHAEHVHDSLVQSADGRRGGARGDGRRRLPGHAQSFALLHDVFGDVTSAVVARRRPRQADAVVDGARHEHVARRTRLVCISYSYIRLINFDKTQSNTQRRRSWGVEGVLTP